MDTNAEGFRLDNHTSSLTAAYIKGRRVVRSVVHGIPWLDHVLAKRLVRLDLFIRRRGVLDSALSEGMIRSHGLTIYFDPREPDEAAELLTNGTYEPDTLQTIQDMLPAGGTFVDLGAHVGFFSLIAARHVGSEGRVYSFEPTPDVYCRAERNFSANQLRDRITLEGLAVGGRVGEVQFVLVPGASQANSVEQPGDMGNRIVVPMTTLDEYFKLKGWPRVDLVKMDIEGQELAAIKGMRELVTRNPELSLIFEYHRAQLRRAGTDPAELFYTLQNLGFRTFSSLHRTGGRLDMPADLAQLDVLATRSNLNILCTQSVD